MIGIDHRKIFENYNPLDNYSGKDILQHLWAFWKINKYFNCFTKETTPCLHYKFSKSIWERNENMVAKRFLYNIYKNMMASALYNENKKHVRF